MRAALHQDQDYCQGCPLFREKRNSTVYIPTDVIYDRVDEEGLPKVDLLIVGESPSRSDDIAGFPFSSAAGTEIKSALRKAGVDSSYALSNVVRCRPRDTSGAGRNPTVEEVAACVNYLRQDIEQLDPKVIVLVGGQAVRVLSDKKEWKGKSVTALQGQVHQTEDGITHLVTVHPSSFIRSDSATQRRRFFRHFKSAGRFVTGKHTAFSSRGGVEILDTIERFDEIIDWLEKKCKVPVAVDFETQNLNLVATNKVATLQLSADNDLAYVIPLQHWDSPWSNGELKHVRKRLRRLFGSNKTKIPLWIMHNAQFDSGIAFNYLKIKKIAKLVIDTLFLAYLQDENQCGDTDGGSKRVFTSFSLKTLARELLGFYFYDTELSDALAARSGADGGSLWNLPLDRLSEYGGADAYVTRRLFYFYSRWLASQGYDKAVPFAKEWYGRVAHLLTKMSAAGFSIDPAQLDYLRGSDSPILTRLEELPGLIYSTDEAKKANSLMLQTDDRTSGMRPLFGKKPWILNIRKKDHRIKIFVDSCGLEPISYTKKTEEPQIDKAYFDHYKHHPVIQLYKEYSGLDKLRSSYLESVDELLYSNPDNIHDGRIHAGFHVTRTVTGRMASLNPNLQQLPKGSRNNAKSAIRSMYCASPGHMLVECDFGQAEVRWWAQLAGDKQYAALFHEMKALRDLYKETGDGDLGKKVKAEADIHRKVASIMFRKSLYAVTSDERKRAKALCVKRGTRIRTSRGLERVEDVVPLFTGDDVSLSLTAGEGQEILSARKGSVTVETSIGMNEATVGYAVLGNTIKVTTHHGYEVEGRPEHQILVWRDCSLQYVELKEVLPSDYAVVRRSSAHWPSCNVGNLVAPTPEPLGRPPVFLSTCPLTLGPLLARLLGYLSAEGTCGHSGRRISIDAKNETIRDDVTHIISFLFGHRGWGVKGDSFDLHSMMSDFLRINGLCPLGTSHTKSVPEPIFSSPRTVVVEYLRGYFAGDGSLDTHRRRFRVGTVSEQLAKDVQLLLLELGIASRRTLDPPGGIDSWVVSCTGDDFNLLMEVLPPIRPVDVPSPSKPGPTQDFFPGLQDRIRDFTSSNPYVRHGCTTTNRKFSRLPYSPSAKTMTVRWVRHHKEEIVRGLRDMGEEKLSSDICKVLSGDWLLSPIVSTEHCPTDNLFDFTVPGPHDFVSNGIISHNCFGAIYGQHFKTLAVILGVTAAEAKGLQTTFIQEFRRAGKWLTDIEREAATFGFVSTPMGRRRHLADMFESDEKGAARRARNSPIQAVSSDVTTLCAWRIQDWIERNDRPYRVINCVHDAVTVEVPLDYAMVEETVDIFQEMMVDTLDAFLLEHFGIEMILPMEIDYDLGVRWGHMVGYDGVRSSLRPIFDRCVAWDDELSSGTPWNEISYREFATWDCSECGTENHDSKKSCSSCCEKK